jgi:hypothetical protein
MIVLSNVYHNLKWRDTLHISDNKVHFNLNINAKNYFFKIIETIIYIQPVFLLYLGPELIFQMT